jgi:hypothetical protein
MYRGRWCYSEQSIFPTRDWKWRSGRSLAKSVLSPALFRDRRFPVARGHISESSVLCNGNETAFPGAPTDRFLGWLHVTTCVVLLLLLEQCLDGFSFCDRGVRLEVRLDPRQDQSSSRDSELSFFQHSPHQQEHVMRPSVHRSRNALFLSARRYQHHVSAQKQASGLNAANHQTAKANGAQSGMEKQPTIAIGIY